MGGEGGAQAHENRRPQTARRERRSRSLRRPRSPPGSRTIGELVSPSAPHALPSPRSGRGGGPPQTTKRAVVLSDQPHLPPIAPPPRPSQGRRETNAAAYDDRAPQAGPAIAEGGGPSRRVHAADEGSIDYLRAQHVVLVPVPQPPRLPVPEGQQEPIRSHQRRVSVPAAHLRRRSRPETGGCAGTRLQSSDWSP